MLGMSRWRHRHLLAAWAAYWVALVGVKLGGAIASLLTVTGPGGHGSASGSFGDNGVTFTVINSTSTIWTGTSTFAAIALWFAGPPLALWLVWMLSRPKGGASQAYGEASSQLSDQPVRPLQPPQDGFDRPQRDRVHERRPGE